MFHELHIPGGQELCCEVNLISIQLFSSSNSQRFRNENYSPSLYRLDVMGKCIICIYIESWTQGYQSNLKARCDKLHYQICFGLKTKKQKPKH